MKPKYLKCSLNVNTESGKSLMVLKALKDFSNVKKGDYSGVLTDDSDLSQDGDCWVYPGSYVESSKITGNTKISGISKIFNSSLNCHKIKNSIIRQCDLKCFDLNIKNSHILITNITSPFKYRKNLPVYEHKSVIDKSVIKYSSLKNFRYIDLSGSRIDGCIFGAGTNRYYFYLNLSDCEIYSNSLENHIQFNITSSLIQSKLLLHDLDSNFNFIYSSPRDILTIERMGSRDDTLTCFLIEFDGKLNFLVQTGCFCDTLDKFEEAVNITHKDNPNVLTEYNLVIGLIKERLKHISEKTIESRAQPIITKENPELIKMIAEQTAEQGGENNENA